MSTPVIEVKHLYNQFGDQMIHQDINFTIERGEIIGIIGGSGSGKTTLLRCLLMLLKPTRGEIRIFGCDITQMPFNEAQKIQRRWGVLFQQSALFAAMTVLENVMFPLGIFTHLDKTRQRELALLKIGLSGLPQKAASKYPSELSGGMLKRAALARALIMDPELLFLDEPTSGLDPESSRSFDDLISRLRDYLNLTIVMITHDVKSLTNVCDEAIFLGDKKLIAKASVSELMKNPNPLIQAYFAGERR